MDNLWQQLLALQGPLLWVVGGIVVLFLAWVFARIGAYLVRRALQGAKVDERASASLGTKTSITKWVSSIVFWVLFIVAIWQVLILVYNLSGGQIDTVAYQSPLTELINVWVVNLFNVGVFLLVAWLVASILRFLVIRVLNLTRVEERLGEATKGKPGATSASIGNAVFWLTFLIFTPSILSSLGMGEVASQVQSVGNQILSFIPGVLLAIIILVLGALLARILRAIVTGFLEGIGADQYGERVGLSKAQNTMSLSTLLGTVAYVLVMVPVIVQALGALNLPVITSIGTQLLSSVTTAIISVLGAAVILGVTYYVARFIADVASSLLAGIGINRLPAALGFKTAKDANLSEVIGYVVLVAVMLLAVQGTAEAIGLTTIAAVVESLIAFGGSVLLGIVIFIAGIYLANIAANVIVTTGGSDAVFLANLARWAILIFVAGIALSLAGVTLAENAIVIILATLGVAVALAFGLGGREIAAKQLDKWFGRRVNK